MTPPLVVRGASMARGQGRRARRVLDGVDLTLAAGEVALLEGPSGSGKTTLLLVAAGLLTPDAGEVTVAGEPMSAADAAGRRALRARRLGFVFQRANLFDSLSVLDNVRLAALLAGMTPAEATEASRALLDALGVGAYLDASPATLSGGEEHRVGVARALVHRPAVVLADEPTGNLDAASGRAVAELLARHARLRGAAVLIATHDARLAPWADRRLLLTDGRLAEGRGEGT